MGTNLRFPEKGLSSKRVWATVIAIALAIVLSVWRVCVYQHQARPAPTTVTASSPVTRRELALGEELEKQDRGDEAEKAYVKAVEGAVTPSDTEAAKERLIALEKERRTFSKKYWKPSSDDFLGSIWKALVGLVGAALVFGFLWTARALLKLRPGYFKENVVAIGEFIDGAGNGAADSFREHVQHAMEQVREYHKPRLLWHFKGSRMTVLVVPGSDDLFDIASEVVPDIGEKALVFLKKSVSAPRYKLSGVVHRSGVRFLFLLRLDDRGDIVKVWESEARCADAMQVQQALAYSVALRVKEYVDDRGNE